MFYQLCDNDKTCSFILTSLMIMSWYHINRLGRRISHRYDPASFVAICIGPYHPVVVPVFDHFQKTTDQTNVVYFY